MPEALKHVYWRLDKKLRRKLDPYPHMGYVRRRGFLFIHIPKAAGTSINKALGLHFRRHDDWRVFDAANPKLFRSAFKFAFVRNPYIRCASTYFYLRNGGTGPNDDKIAEIINTKAPTFDAFVHEFLDDQIVHTHPLLRPQFFFVCDEAMKIRVDFVGRVENIQGDFDYICDKIGKKKQLKKFNNGNVQDYAGYFDKDIKKKIGKLYRGDFVVFGYEF